MARRTISEDAFIGLMILSALIGLGASSIASGLHANDDLSLGIGLITFVVSAIVLYSLD